MVLLTEGFGFSFELTMYCALILPSFAYTNFLVNLNGQEQSESPFPALLAEETEGYSRDKNSQTRKSELVAFDNANRRDIDASSKQMTSKERLQHTLNLWPYMVPLTIVYFSEYAMQVVKYG